MHFTPDMDFSSISKVIQTFWKIEFPGKVISIVKQNSYVIEINQVKVEIKWFIFKSKSKDRKHLALEYYFSNNSP